jgi:hypothetical protein
MLPEALRGTAEGFCEKAGCAVAHGLSTQPALNPDFKLLTPKIGRRNPFVENQSIAKTMKNQKEGNLLFFEGLRLIEKLVDR